MAPLAPQGGIKKTQPHAAFPASNPTGTGPGMNDRVKGQKSPSIGANSKSVKFTKGPSK